MAQGLERIPAGADVIAGGRFTIIAMPSDAPLARSLLADATATDTFPGLPRPRDRATIYIAPDDARFREWAGDGVPEWAWRWRSPGNGAS